MPVASPQEAELPTGLPQKLGSASVMPSTLRISSQ